MARVIVADESRLVRRMFQRLLGDAGHEVLVFSDGLEAVEAAHTENIDVIVLDVVMPRMNGCVACRLLKSEPSTRGIPVLMLSGQVDFGDRYWGLETGADRYVTKNAPPERLLELVQELAALPRPHRALPAGQERSEIDILGRVSELLDRKLYEATILSELGQVAGSLEHVDEAFTSVMEVGARAVEYSVGSLAFAEGEELEIMGVRRRLHAPADHRQHRGGQPSRLRGPVAGGAASGGRPGPVSRQGRGAQPGGVTPGDRTGLRPAASVAGARLRPTGAGW
jgi:CheY-like chemotaxis protein